MATLCNFVKIRGDVSLTVPVVAAGAQFNLPDFDTTDRISTEPALLTYVIKDLTNDAKVFINNTSVGTISSNDGGFFTTQQMVVDGATLVSGLNTIHLENVADAFQIKAVVLFFHKPS